MSNGTDIAAEVHAAILDAASATGSGELTATLYRDSATNETVYPPTPAAEQTFTVRVVLLDYSARDRDGTLIRAGDIKVMVSAVGEAPQEGDRLAVGGRTYSVISVKTVQPGGVALMYEVQARGA